jgi:hypothetical protein
LTEITQASPAQVWKIAIEFIGPPVDSRAFHISKWLRNGGMTFMPPSDVWKWVEGDVATRAWYLATFVPPILGPEPDTFSWARDLLVRYGNRKDVRDNLQSNFLTGSWTGAASSYYQSQRHMFQELSKRESHPNVLQWLAEIAATLSSNVQISKVYEESEF